MSVFFLITLFVALTFQFVETFAWIGDKYENEDEAFVSIMQEMKVDQGFDYDDYTYTKAALYNTSSELSGYVYDFTLDGERDGFVLMIKLNDDWYEVTEIFVDIKSKFYGNNGVNLYPKLLSYISYIDNAYYDLTLQQEISLEDVINLELQGFGFSGGDPIYTQWSETIYYANRTVSTTQISTRIPAYTVGPTIGTNGCAVTAGTIFVGYWDAFKPNLIPNYTPVNIYYGIYYWKGETSTITSVANDLYDKMGTNTQGPGTTISQFKTGITDYASVNGGYSTTYTSTMTSGTYDLSKMLAQFSLNRPVALFMTPDYNFVSVINANNGNDYITQTDYIAAHVMVAYGRQINTYYNYAGVQTRQITFLRVAGCSSGAGLGWIRLNEGSLTINDSFSIQIS